MARVALISALWERQRVGVSVGKVLAGIPAVVLAIAAALAGCGGGGGTGGGQPPPHPPSPQADFLIAASAESVNVAQGGTSAPVTVSVTGENGFSGNVQVALSALPAGITSNPISPFTLTAGQSTMVIFGAAANASTGQFNLSAQGTSGALTHTAAFSLTVQATPAANLSRTMFARNDSQAAWDQPEGEPRQRHIIYDAAGQRYFVANRAMNRVEVFAAANAEMQASVDVAGASSVDLSADGKTLWVGTALEQLIAVDPSSLQVRAQVPVPGISPIPGAIFNRPVETVALSSGKLLVRLRQPAAARALLALYDPAGNQFTDLTSAAPAVFQNGVGVMARSQNQNLVFVGANDSSGEVAVFDASGKVAVGPQTLGGGTILMAAANQDGSRFAVVFVANGSAQLRLLDGGLNPLGTYSTTNPSGTVFSRDGQSIYVAEASNAVRVVTTLSATNLQITGRASDIAVQGKATNLEEAGDTPFVAGISNRGIAFLDATPASISLQAAPEFNAAPAVVPAEGPLAGGTAVTLSGGNFSPAAQIRFGAVNPIAASSSNGATIQVSSPASAVSGPVNLTAYFSDGSVALAPDGFSYGPAISQVLPNAGSNSGGDKVVILGYGFGSSASNLSVTIGGKTAAIQKVEALSTFAASAGLPASYPFSLERITLTTPGGTAGKADIVVNSGSGSTTMAKGFQFLANSQTYAHAGLYKFVLYDSSRQQVFLTATDHVDVFDTTTLVYKSALQPPPNGPPPSAGLRGMAMTPDHSQLVVADFGAQNIYLINPDGAAYNGTTIPVGGVAGFLNSGPSRVAATSAQTVFVGLSGEGGAAGGCNACLGQMDLTANPPTFQPAPQPEVTSLTGAPLLQANESGDAVYLAFGTAPGGPVAAWSAMAPNSFTVSSANDSTADLATAGDGTMFAMRSNNTTELRSETLTLIATPTASELENIPGRVAVPGVTVHPSGALFYEPFLDGPPPSAPPAVGIHGGIDVRDAHSGRLRMRVYLPEPFAMLSTDTDGLHGGFLSVDENGQRLFALTTSGLTIVQLASVPLGIGTLSVTSGPAAGGTSLTLRGSGFQSGTRVTLGGKATQATYKDMNTLMVVTPAMSAGAQQMVLTNPDGESVSLDAAFVAE